MRVGSFCIKPYRTAFILFSLASAALALADSLPSASSYRGEIRRDPAGKLVAVTEADQRATNISPSGKTILVGPDHPVKTIAGAARLAKDGDTIEIEAGDYLGDVAVWQQQHLTIRGRHPDRRPKLIANGASAERKAIWVIRGGAITVENIEFIGARVADKNGAGIRFEKGQLTIRNCRFIDNENGILTGGDPAATLDIENSEFGHNGAGDGYSHNLYVGTIDRLRVVGSYFHHAQVGHLLKSRARENHIRYNRLTDEAGGRASYELEFPSGGLAYVIGNLIEQSATTDNSNIISFGAEGYRHPSNELYLINNTLHNNRPAGSNFLAVKPGAQRIKAYNNLLIGKGPIMSGSGIESVNNPNVDGDPFVLSQRHDYRIKRESTLHRSYVTPGSANDIPLAPSHEYRHPATTRPLQSAPTLPGARQTSEPDDV